MARQRRASDASSGPDTDQELGSMYDYLAKIILLGPSGTGKTCLLHRLLNHEWRSLTSQTIGVEFSTHLIPIGRTRIKLQLWDTAGTERFRSVSRSYYRGAAGALLVYDVANRASFDALPHFWRDARALASRHLVGVLVGNKADLAAGAHPALDGPGSAGVAGSAGSRGSAGSSASGSKRSSAGCGLGTALTATTAAEGREIAAEEAARWASGSQIPVCVEVSAYTGEGVDEVFARLARMILTKIELGEIDPDDPSCGIQYGDVGGWEGGSVKSAGDEGRGRRRRRAGTGGWVAGMREWEAVFRLDGRGGRRGGGCC